MANIDDIAWIMLSFNWQLDDGISKLVFMRLFLEKTLFNYYFLKNS